MHTNSSCEERNLVLSCPPMDFRLKVFKKVADLLSYTKAARELNISQPAVSKHISKLEEHFEKALILREGNRISLTSEGQLLLSYANKILDQYQQLENDFLAMQDKMPDSITVGASTTITQYILPKALSELKNIYPDLHITLINGNTEKIEQLVEKQEIDIGFTEGRSSNPLLHYQRFRRDEIVLATRVSNRQLKREELRLEDLYNLPFIIREEGSGTRRVIESTLLHHGIHPDRLNVEMVIGSTEGIKTYLLNKDTYAFVSIHAILQELKGNFLKIIDVRKLDIKRDLHYVHLHGKHSQAIKIMQRYFGQAYNKLE
ncbi:MAG: LysR family transcriptional regulator [Bacteroidota bacterium]